MANHLIYDFVVNFPCMETKLNPVIVNKAVDIYATQPNVHHKDVANELGINPKTLKKLRSDANFWKQVYDYFMVSYEGEIIDVVRAMLREAKAGNTSAGRLVMEHSGKLKQHLNIRITSPYEQWMSSQGKQLEPSKEIPRLKTSEVQNAEIIEPPDDVKDEIDVMDKKLIKKKKWLDRMRELHSWYKRAEAVGIAPLPAKRPTKGQRLAWEESIVRAEQEQLNSNEES